MLILAKITNWLIMNFANSPEEVTRIGSEIADLNVDIVSLSGPGTGDPNDLLDKRDLLVRDLSELVGVQTIPDRFGALTVIIGETTPLVIGDQSFRMGIQNGQSDPAQQEVYLEGVNNNNRLRLIGNRLDGKIGALFQYRDEVLAPALDRMGLSVLALADAFNTEQGNGADLNGNLGINLFNDINADDVRQRRAYSTSDNTGDLTMDVSITNVSDLRAAEFEIEFLGAGQYQITNLTDGTVGTMSASTTADFGHNRR